MSRYERGMRDATHWGMNKSMSPAQFKRAHDAAMKYAVNALKESAALRAAMGRTA